MVRSQGWTQTSHPSELVLLPLFYSRIHTNPTPSSPPQSQKCIMQGNKKNKKEQELPDHWGSFFCLIETGILSYSLDLLCAMRVQLQWLRPLVAPVSSSAPGRGDCPASLDPFANYFQSSWDLYHSHAGASGTTVPPGSSFSGFSLLLGGQRLSPWTWVALGHKRSEREREREPASWWDFDVFQIQIASSNCANGLKIRTSPAQRVCSVIETIWPFIRLLEACPVKPQRAGVRSNGSFCLQTCGERRTK